MTVPARAHRVRRNVNRIVVVIALVFGLPLVAVAGGIRRQWGRRVARAVVRATAAACGVRFVVRHDGRVRAGSSSVYVANHSSPLDIPALLVALPDIRFVAASELFRIPLLASAMRALDTVPVDRRSPRTARQQLRELAATDGLFVAVFPEGGIAPPDQRVAFKSGAFALAIDAGAPITPVAIRGSAVVLPGGAAFAVRPGTVTIDVLEPFLPAGTSSAARGALRDAAEAAIRARLDRVA